MLTFLSPFNCRLYLLLDLGLDEGAFGSKYEYHKYE